MSPSREPSADELAGVEWWNSLSEPRRADWLQLAEAVKPAEAWAEFKRRAVQTDLDSPTPADNDGVESPSTQRY